MRGPAMSKLPRWIGLVESADLEIPMDVLPAFHAEYWEARCRLAMGALDDILCLADIYSEKQTKIATAALQAIGPLPHDPTRQKTAIGNQISAGASEHPPDGPD